MSTQSLQRTVLARMEEAKNGKVVRKMVKPDLLNYISTLEVIISSLIDNVNEKAHQEAEILNSQALHNADRLQKFNNELIQKLKDKNQQIKELEQKLILSQKQNDLTKNETEILKAKLARKGKAGRHVIILKEEEKRLIRQMRANRKGYNCIAKELSMSNRRVIDYCKDNNL